MSETTAGDVVTHDPFAGPALAARLPLTGAQREIWLAVQTMPGCELAYNETGTLRLRGPLDVPALLAGLQALVDRHEALRSTFSPDGAWMCVEEERRIDVPVVDISADPARLLAEHERAAASRVLDLEHGPLVEWTLLRAGEDDHYLLCAAHHIVMDGWTTWLVCYELGRLYTAALRPDGVEALPPADRYGDYAQVERDFAASPEGRRHLDFWLDTLADPPNALHLPHDLPRPAERTFEARRVDVPVAPELATRLRDLGAAHGASQVVTTLAAFAALLHRLSGQEDVIVGLAAAGQSFHEVPNLAGHAVNLLPLRLRPRADQRFDELLAETRGHLLDAYDHQGVSFGEIVPQLRFDRDPSRPPLIPVMFNIDVRSGDVVFEGLESEFVTVERRAEIFELFINMVDEGGRLLLECSYNRNLFSDESIRARLREYETLLTAVCDDPTVLVGDLPLLDEQALARWAALNETAVEVGEASLVDRIVAQAERTPDAVAVVAGGQRWDYRRLLGRAAAVAAALSAEGVGAGDLVGVCVDRTPDLPAALLGVLMSGAGYVPLDADFPEERLAYYVADAGCDVVLADDASAPALRAATARVLSMATVPDSADLRTVPVGADLPAYVIYTSGSTGRPKGVVLTRRALLNVMLDVAGRLDLPPEHVQLGVTTAAFDIAACDFFLPFLTGGTLLLAQRTEVVDGAALARMIDEHGVRMLQCTPGTWRLLLQAGWSGSPGLTGVSTGEPLPRDLAEELLPRLGALWNLYGPTETTIWSTGHQVVDASRAPLIGVPLANTRCFVLDARGRLVPPGVIGELWIGGAGLALGYHERPELTAERFVEHPELGRLYHTGDLARLLPDGLECLGRVDFQVKLRGYRIELGEIEYALSQHAAAAEAVADVLERGPGDPRLVAWIQLREDVPEPTAGEVRESLRAFLPPYMVPQQIVMLPELPRLPNGKLDRSALPSPFAVGRHLAEVTRTPPASAAERVLADAWRAVLSVDSVSREDRFLDLGGHSLLAVEVAVRLEREIGRRPVLRSLLTDPLSVVAASLADAPGLADAGAPAPTAGPTITPTSTPVAVPAAPPAGAGGSAIEGRRRGRRWGRR